MNRLDELIERSREYDSHKADYLVLRQGVTFNQQSQMVVPSGVGNSVVALNLTDWALQQLCTKLGPPPIRYMRKCPDILRAVNLSHWVRFAMEDKHWLVRAYDDNARAVLSDRYTRISNTKVLEMTNELLQDTPHKLVTPHLDSDTLHLKVTMANGEWSRGSDGNGDNYGVGTYVGNGETGNRSVRILPFIQRNSCSNSIIYQEGGFIQRHYRVSEAFIYGALKEKIGQAFGFSAEMINKMVMAEAEAIPDIGAVVKRICKEHSLSQEVHDTILIGTEGCKTRFGLVNGISFAANTLEDIERQVDLQCMAGAVLCEPDSLFGKILSREYAEVLR